jgi:hypothetical protein
VKRLNIAETEVSSDIIAKTCKCKDRDRKVTYSFLDSYHSLCIDKKDILCNELIACERLLKYSREPLDKRVIEREIGDLKLMLDLIQ